MTEETKLGFNSIHVREFLVFQRGSVNKTKGSVSTGNVRGSDCGTVFQALTEETEIKFQQDREVILVLQIKL